MFSRNGQYIVNEFEEDTFDKQLPSQSTKIPFKKVGQKVFNRMQLKNELQLLKQQIHQKCKAEQLDYLDQLQKERRKFNRIKDEEQKNKKQYMLKFFQNKYQLQQEDMLHANRKRKYKTERPMRDSIDQMQNLGNEKNSQRLKRKQQFSLQPSKQKEQQLAQQDKWVKRVMHGRKVLQAKFGKYYQKGHVRKESDSQSSQTSK